MFLGPANPVFVALNPFGLVLLAGGHLAVVLGFPERHRGSFAKNAPKRLKDDTVIQRRKSLRGKVEKYKPPTMDD